VPELRHLLLQLAEAFATLVEGHWASRRPLAGAQPTIGTILHERVVPDERRFAA
jgi:hypothetical protein